MNCTNKTQLFVCLVSGSALVPVSGDGADVEEVLAVLTQGVFGGLVAGLEIYLTIISLQSR